MTRLAWLTDVHLDFVAPAARDALCARVVDSAPDALLVGGDVGVAADAIEHVEAIARAVDRPVYFVLGNHDFYQGRIADVRAAAAELSRTSRHARWLPAAGVVPLSDRTALVGHDGWSDGRAGDWDGSSVFLNDYLRIEELVTPDKAERRRRLERLGDEAAAHLAEVVPRALAAHQHVVVLTHVPPFREACWHAGQISGEAWLPHFTCVAVGEVLRAAMRARPSRRMTVLCGHTHGAGVASVLPNLRVVTGGATYGMPAPQEPLVVD